MKPISCTISGFRAYGSEKTINFNDGLTAIVGPNKSGKSSTFLAIMWALYGPAALRDIGITQGDCVHEGFDRCRVSLEFEAGGLLHRVDREYLASGTTKLNLIVSQFFATGGAGSDLTGATVKETQATIDSLVGEYSVAAQSWYCGQDADKSFLLAPPSERMEVFSALLPSRTNWDVLHVLAQGKRKLAERDQQIAVLEVERLKLEVQEHPNLVQAEVIAKLELNVAREELIEAEAELTRLQAEAEGMEKRKAAGELVTSRQSEMNVHRNARDSATQIIGRKAEIAASQKDQVEKLRLYDEAIAAYDYHALEISQFRLARQISTVLFALQAEETAVIQRQDAIRAEIKDLEEADACPTCGRTYDQTTNSHIASTINGKREEEIAVQSTWRLHEIKAMEEIDLLKAQRDVTITLDMTQPEPQAQPRPLQPEQSTALSADINVLDTAEKDIEALENVYHSSRESFQKAKAALEELGPESEPKQGETVWSHEQYVLRDRKAVESAVIAHAAATHRLETARKAVTTLAETETALSAAQERLNDYELLVRATGPRGVRQLAVSQSLAGINSTVNRALEILDPGTSLYLDTQREAGDGSQAETLEATIIGPDGVAAFGTRSGAEKSRVALAVRVALEIARAQSLGSESNATIILDEVVGAQDQIGQDNLFRFMNWLTSDLGVNVLFVSHDTQFVGRVDQAIHIEKVNGEAVLL